MNNLTIALAGFAGFAIYEMTKGDAVAVPPRIPTSTNKDAFSTRNGMTVKPLVSDVPRANAATGVASYSGLPRSKMLFGTALRVGNASVVSKTTASASGQLADQMTAKLKTEYNKLSGEAKQAAAKELNNLIKPSPNLTGKETFEEASKKVGAALGGALGTALGAGLGPVGATLGAIAGAYLGEKLGPEVAKAWNDLKSHFANAYDSVKDAVTESADKAVDAVKDFVGNIF